MSNLDKQLTLIELCELKGVKVQDVEDLLELYNSDAPEDDVLKRIEQYPISARQLVSSLILPPMIQ